MKKILSYILFLSKNSFFIFKSGLSNRNNLLLSCWLAIRYVYDDLFFCRRIRKKYHAKINEFTTFCAEKRLNDDWFSGNIPVWYALFEKHNLLSQKLVGLEIGAYEGRSSLFMLKSLPRLNLHCVDTFQGSDEHDEVNFNTVFENFTFNVNEYADRLKVFKGTSATFYLTRKDKVAFYDIIYVDGSHHYNDVLHDAQQCLRLLKKNGLMIFDDYLWGFYDDINKNPIGAIHNFLAQNRKNLTILVVGNQMVIQKQ